MAATALVTFVNAWNAWMQRYMVQGLTTGSVK